MIPGKFPKGKGYFAIMMSAVFVTATSTPISAQPKTPTLSQLPTTETPSTSGNQQPVQALGGQLAIFVGHEGGVTSAVFSPDGRQILTASDDNTARLWDKEGNLLSVLQHSDRVASAEFSPDGDCILTASGYSNSPYLWDRQGNLLAELRGGRIGKFSPDGNFILTVDYADNTAFLWDKQGKLLAELKHQDDIESAEFSPDGSLILTRSFNGREPRLWDRQGNLLATFQGHQQSVQSAEFSPDSRYVLTTSLDGTARLWDREGNSFTIYDYDPQKNVPVSAQFSPNGQHILLSGGFTSFSYLLLDRQGNRLAEFPGHSGTFSPDGNFVLTADEKTAYLWDKSGNLITEFQGHERRVHSPRFSSDGRYIVTAGFFEVAYLWDKNANRLAEFRHEGEVTHVEFSADGLHLIILSYHPLNNPGGSLDPTAELWNMEGNTSNVVQLGRVTSAKFSPDGHHILVADLDNSARLVDKQGNLLTVFQHENRVEGAQFSPDGNRVITTSADNTARLWEKEGKLLAIFRGHKTVITSAVFSSDGHQVITVSRDNTARLWDVPVAIAAQAEQVTALQSSQTNVSVTNNQQAAEIVQQAVQLDQQGTVTSR
jgi:WD40 repeat protein